MYRRVLIVLALLSALLVASACDAPIQIDPSVFPSPIALPTFFPLPQPVATPPPSSASLPDMPQKPQPQQITFKGCPPDGDGGDRALNRLKNRVDEGSYIPVAFEAVSTLAWPKRAEGRDRDQWSAATTAAVARHEGLPLSIEGYLASAREAGTESTNCHGDASEFRDWHVWLVQNPGDSRAVSIITETTPRVRASHPGWTLPALQQIAESRQRVRISGWLMFDPEHPDQLNNTRGTLWELHPIMRIEVQIAGLWLSLDNPLTGH